MQPYQIATDFLSALDNDWAALIATVGPCTFEARPEREPFQALVRAVAYQQLHGKAGDAIIKRFLAMYDGSFPTPNQLLASEF
ncbi:MAG: DNA-3-methyladenine glycosylase 2 family protein, partial [Pseudomonadota bacterium]